MVIYYRSFSRLTNTSCKHRTNSFRCFFLPRPKLFYYYYTSAPCATATPPMKSGNQMIKCGDQPCWLVTIHLKVLHPPSRSSSLNSSFNSSNILIPFRDSSHLLVFQSRLGFGFAFFPTLILSTCLTETSANNCDAKEVEYGGDLYPGERIIWKRILQFYLLLVNMLRSIKIAYSLSSPSSFIYLETERVTGWKDNNLAECFHPSSYPSTSSGIPFKPPQQPNNHDQKPASKCLLSFCQVLQSTMEMVTFLWFSFRVTWWEFVARN